ncbi:hypothetical protein [Nonomuraea lactucae]|nr:hypothetical protein [Nonomuraea lactucae]
MALPDHDHVLLHQISPVGWWMITQVDEEYLQRIEKDREPETNP